MVSLLYSLSLAASLVSSVAAHGLVESVTVNGKTFQASQVIRKVRSQDPLTDSKSDTLICNTPGTSSTKSFATANPGDKLTFNWQWTTDRHPGPMTTWLARCGDADTSCNGFNPTGAVWFKIHEVGLLEPSTNYNGGNWASDKLKRDGNKWTITIPQGLKKGAYLLRHDITAMHLVGRPEFYPSCTHLKVGGSGTGLPSSSQLVSIPGYLQTQDSQRALKFNIFDKYNSFKVAGPAPITSFTGRSGGKAASAPVEDDESVPGPGATGTSPTVTDGGIPTSNATDPTSSPTSGTDGINPTDGASAPASDPTSPGATTTPCTKGGSTATGGVPPPTDVPSDGSTITDTAPTGVPTDPSTPTGPETDPSIPTDTGIPTDDTGSGATPTTTADGAPCSDDGSTATGGIPLPTDVPSTDPTLPTDGTPTTDPTAPGASPTDDGSPCSDDGSTVTDEVPVPTPGVPAGDPTSPGSDPALPTDITPTTDATAPGASPTGIDDGAPCDDDDVPALPEETTAPGVSQEVPPASPTSDPASTPSSPAVDPLPECPTGTGSTGSEVDPDTSGEDDASYDYTKRFVKGVNHARGLLRRMNGTQGKRRLARWH